MGYIHCCGALHKTRSFRLVPRGKFVVSELDYLKKCPVCGNEVVQLTRIDKNDNISVVRRTKDKALRFFEKLKRFIFIEIRAENDMNGYHGKFYLNYNEFGVKKKCYSNLSKLKMGKFENGSFNNDDLFHTCKGSLCHI